MTKKKRKQILQRSGLHIFYIILCLLALVPILYALNLSFERGSGALSSGLSLFPKEFTLDNYKNILTQKPFLRWFYNSAVLSFFTMVIAIGFAVVSSYAFSRYRFKGTASLKCIPTDPVHVCIIPSFKTDEYAGHETGTGDYLCG